MRREYDLPAADGRWLRVMEDGDPEGVPLITMHGTPGSRMLLPSVIRSAIEHGICVIGYDRPGYGGSTPHPGRTVADAAADVEAIADGLGLERILVDGVSGGGPHALACAAKLGDRVAAVGLYASLAPADALGLDFLAGMGDDNAEEWTAAAAGRDTLAPIIEAKAAEILSITVDDLAAALRANLSPVDAAAVTGELAEYFLFSFCLAVEVWRDGWIDDDLAFVRPWGFDIADVSVPVGLWHGEQDQAVPPAHGRWLAANVPGVEAHITPDDGHLTLAGDELVDISLDWLVSRYRA
jgi:pimeloyl-ACP methyl ester carboxylesterase